MISLGQPLLLNFTSRILFQLPRGAKRDIQLLFDAPAIAFCFWLGMVLRLDGVGTTLSPSKWSVLIAVIPVTLGVLSESLQQNYVFW